MGSDIECTASAYSLCRNYSGTMDGFFANMIKYLLFATNFLVFLMALVVLAFGVYALVDGASLADLVSAASPDAGVNLYDTAVVLVIVVATFVMVVAFFGCCGAWKENRCMLGTYFAVILLMFIVMIVGAVFGYSQSLDELKKPLLASMGRYDPTDGATADQKAVTAAWDQVQMDYTCCGVDSYTEWKESNNAYLDGEGYEVPASCCKGGAVQDEAECQADPTADPGNLDSCYAKFEAVVSSHANIILAVAIVVVVVMFMNMIFAFAMCTMAD